MPLRRILALPLLFALSACQQAAWKAGASADDLRRDEASCRAQQSEAIATAQCLRDKGWKVADYQPPPEARRSDNIERAHSPAANGAPLTETVSAGATPPSGAVTATPREKTAGSMNNPIDPLQKLSVQTWWKAGAQAGDFDRDSDGCLSQLGEQHRPDYPAHLYSRALVECLRERGWRAGYDPVYAPLR